jgi:phage-related protein
MFYTGKITNKSQKNKSISAISASFGDSYEQIAPEGTNPIKDSWTIFWSDIITAEKDIIENAIIKTGSWDIYIWTPLYETNAKKFRIVKDSYEREAITTTSFNISLKFVQVFDFT